MKLRINAADRISGGGAKAFPGASSWLRIHHGKDSLPSVTTGGAVSLLWLWISNPRFGVINVVLDLVGIKGPTWLGSEIWALPVLILMRIRGVGDSMLIYLSGRDKYMLALGLRFFQS